MKKLVCDIIIPVWNQLEFTKRCIDSIERTTFPSHRLILIDNKSDRDTEEYLRCLAKRLDHVTLIRNSENLGFIKATNQGLKLSTSPYVCLMNNDTIATDGWLTRMISVAESDPKIGLVNPRSESSGRLSLEDYSEKLSSHKGEYIETNQCMGFCMLMKKEVLEKVGYLDEAFGMGGFDDTDFSRRADLAGYKCVCAKDAYVYHDWHTSFDKAGNREILVKKNEEIYFNKWGRFLRIGYPITCRKASEFYADILTSLGLAREWNWVHAWLRSNRLMAKELESMNLPEHQNLRSFHLSGINFIFYIGVLFRLVERRLKRKKHFDLILVSDDKLFKFLYFFRKLFLTPVVYIERNDLSGTSQEGESERSWRRRAKGIIERSNQVRERERV